MTRVGRIIKSRKLSPKFLGPYQILCHVGPIAYQIDFPSYFSNINDVFCLTTDKCTKSRK